MQTVTKEKIFQLEWNTENSTKYNYMFMLYKKVCNPMDGDVGH